MIRLGFLCLVVLFFALPKLRAEEIDNRNFAIDTCYPTPNEIKLAEQRARNYWAKHAARFGSNPPGTALLDFRDQILNHNQHEKSKVIRSLSEPPFDHCRSDRLFWLRRHASAK
jgi:hypothetical protein